MTDTPHTPKLDKLANDLDHALRFVVHRDAQWHGREPVKSALDAYLAYKHTRSAAPGEVDVVWIVYRTDDESTHVFSTPEKAQGYADKCEGACVISDRFVDNPERYYARSQ
jgi:hypothetical protein